MQGGTGRAVAIAAAIILFCFSGAVRPLAQQLDVEALGDVPALITADQLTYDEENGLVVAAGNVEISQEDRVLLSDKVTYNLNTDVVTAEGDVTLIEPSGDTVFADFVELTGDLKEGFVRQIRVLMTDGTRVSAASGSRSGGNRTEFSKGVFSPCDLCREDPSRAPLWQIKASEVVHDQEAKDIIYRDAWLEFFGIPVIYTPYFAHPDPTVDRRSGFLAPTVGNSDFLGASLMVPYFWAIEDDKDLTVAPILSTKQGVNLTLEYRQLFENGEIELFGSATIADREEVGSVANDRFRGHLDAEGQFEVDRTWRWGFDVNRVTDDTYLRAFDFGTPRTLESTAFFEGLKGRNYAAVRGFAYQGLRSTDINDEIPIAVPLADYNFVSEPGFGLPGARYTIDGNVQVLTRKEGRDSRRLSFIGGYHVPYTSPLGDIYEVTAQVQTDGYWVNGVEPGSDSVNPSGAAGSNTTGRVFPQLAVKWRYPWARQDGSVRQVIEPIVQGVFAPNGSNPGEIPNEDSLDFEFDDTNLFDLNRFAGNDRVDSGSRVDVGLKWTATFGSEGSAGAFAGQSFRFSEARDTFADGSGLEDQESDVVGRVQFRPIEEIDFLYRFRLDKDDLSAERSEVDLVLGPPALNLDLSYFFINQETDDEFGDREELLFGINSRLTENWSVGVSHRRDLIENDSLRTAVSLSYQDECFLIEGVGERSFFSDRDIEPEDSVFVRVVLKHLGEAAGG
ncbi:LPS-assembly protein LptD [Pelagibius sp.]|uniref:LPS-assembly protein LptD n=1 Tax=Pelagibius sp. TaxID=1931238 RepID=UPI002609BE45|nr:LPS assembly protein LptD [Pelagibius sp.]